jgi:hypothetical protein
MTNNKDTVLTIDEVDSFFINKKELNKYKGMMKRLNINITDKSIAVWINLMKEITK